MTHRRRRTEEELRKSVSASEISRIEFVTKRQFISRLGEIAERVKAEENPQGSGIGKTVLPEANGVSSQERESVAEDVWDVIRRNMERDRGRRDGS